MNNGKYIVVANEQIASGIWSMRLKGDTGSISAPGQFVDILLPELYLRRPISVCDWNENELRLIYKVVGEGTNKMSRLSIGTSLDILIGLGNGYDTQLAGDCPLLIGGGVGVPPLFGLAKRLRQMGKDVQVVLGFNSREDVILADEFANLGCDVRVVTMDGSCGSKGLVTEFLPVSYSYFYACGPMPMLKALANQLLQEGQISLEARMGCGFGICVGCTIQTKKGPQRVCKEGPVFRSSELIMQ